MYIAGLTGGIATGKSTISGMFRKEGALIIDADRIAHEVVKKGAPAWQKIKAHFGDRILLPSGEIDRERLGGIVFHDARQKENLNRIVHPFVFQKMEEKIEKVRSVNPRAVVILDVPLLIETGMHRTLPEVILAYAPESMQLARLMARDNLAEADAQARIRSQMPIDSKMRMADIVIDNSGSLDVTRKTVRDVMGRLQKKARTGSLDGPFRLIMPHNTA